MLPADLDERGGLQFVQRVGRGLAVDAEALGDVLVREAVNRIPVCFPQEQRGDAPAYAFEDGVFELALGFEDAPAEGFEDAAGDLRLPDQEATVPVVLMQHPDGGPRTREWDSELGFINLMQGADPRVRTGEAWYQGDRAIGGVTLPPFGRHAVNLHRALAQ